MSREPINFDRPPLERHSFANEPPPEYWSYHGGATPLPTIDYDTLGARARARELYIPPDPEPLPPFKGFPGPADDFLTPPASSLLSPELEAELRLPALSMPKEPIITTEVFERFLERARIQDEIRRWKGSSSNSDGEHSPPKDSSDVGHDWPERSAAGQPSSPGVGVAASRKLSRSYR
ncbi:hypothetical protein RAS1_07520 [Phycisphaerae bacterium RAS1]|nr:hypothetical protein RAS1_07520 [Phycisphaerae bacterium RAS1]